MELRPITKSNTPTYPEQKTRTSRIRTRRFPRLRKLVACAAGAGALWLAGCDGTLPWEPRLSGDVPYITDFTCSDDLPESPRLLETNGGFEGELCGNQIAYAALDVDQQMTIRVDFVSPPQNVVLDIHAPTGELVAQLTPDVHSVEVDVHAGRWLFLATPEDPNEWSWEHFNIHITDDE